MALKRTTVYVESDDLALIKEAARRRNVPEAEIIRDGVHLAAMASREWDEPFFDEPVRLGGRVTDDTAVERAHSVQASAGRSRTLTATAQTAAVAGGSG